MLFFVCVLHFIKYTQLQTCTQQPPNRIGVIDLVVLSHRIGFPRIVANGIAFGAKYASSIVITICLALSDDAT